MTLETLALQGRKTVATSLAASVAARITELRKAVIKDSFSDFRKADHRLEPVGNVHGIEFINDSRACTVNSAWFALESMTKPVIWIAGGMDPDTDYSPLKPMVFGKVKGIISLGDDDSRLQRAFGDYELPVITAGSMQHAVELAYYMGKKGDVVLLSPGCASFDRFENFEERGIRFRESVKKL
jgi:UDP-N-acetylmuramoylalanine--D-glutamate ligase